MTISPHWQPKFLDAHAVITLIDEFREWLKAKYGVRADLTELPRGTTPFSTTVTGDDILLVPDLSSDDRFSQFPMVAGEPYLRFY